MSLFTRLLGFGLCMLGGLLIGYVQGIQSVVDAVINITQEVVKNTPNLNSPVAYVVAGFVQQYANPTYGSYWEFGILLAVGGFILVARGDRKPRNPEEAEPLLRPTPA